MLSKFLMSPRGFALDRLIVRWLGFSLINHVFARQAGIEPNPSILLETRGRRTGHRRPVVLPYFEIDGKLLVVGSKGGAPTDPYWVENLRQQPRITMVLNRRRVSVSARVAEGDERAQLWPKLTERVPTYAQYQELAQAHREIPVVVLEQA